MWQRGLFHKRRHKDKFVGSQRAVELMANHIGFVVKAAQVIRVCPARTNNGYADRASRQRSVDRCLATCLRRCCEHRGIRAPPQKRFEASRRAAAHTACVVATIANEDAVAIRWRIGTVHPLSFAV